MDKTLGYGPGVAGSNPARGSKMENNFYQIDKQKTTDVWLTPLNLINSLGEFDLDPCCPNNLPWKTAKTYFSLENNQDGLLLPWTGRVWCNPPYSNWVPFLKKLKEHGNGIALIFARTETNGFFEHVWNDADSILFLRRRIKFVNISLIPTKNPAPAPSVLVAYGQNNTISLENSNLEGKFLRLRK